jgi:uncharacterized LabA/DUF88 family protein
MSFLPSSFQNTVRVIQPGQRRLKVFIDFWNLVINARKQTSFEIDIHWNNIAEYLVDETRGGFSDESVGDLAGCYIFGSRSRSNPVESAFIDKTVDQYGPMPGLFFDFRERVKKEASSKCPKCGEPISRSSEQGVDVLLTVELIKHASMREHDFLALVSSDRDFIPLLSYLKDQGQRVLHVATGEAHRDMRSLTWKQIKLREQYAWLCSIVHEHRLILSSPRRPEKLQDAKSVLEKNGLQYRVIDITKPSEINDKDLDFLLRNQRMFFKKKDGPPGQSHLRESLYSSIDDFRKAISDGGIDGNFPHVMCNGQMEAYFDVDQGWIRSGVQGSAGIWQLTGR